MPEVPNSPSTAGPTVVIDPARPSTPTRAGHVPEFLASKMSQQEFDALPESARSVLVDRARDVQETFRQKTTELAQTRKSLDGLLSIQQQLDADPQLAKHLTQSITDYQAGKRGGSGAAKDDWEQLKEDADKEGLKILEAIERRFSHSPVLAKLEALGQQLSQVVSGTQTSRRVQLEQELAGLPKELQALASEHKDAVIRLGLSMPQKSVREVLGIHAFHTGLRSAFEDAVVAERTRVSTDSVEQAKTLGGFPSTAGAPETPATTKDDWQDSRDPRFGPQLKIGNVVARAFGEVRKHLPGG